LGGGIVTINEALRFLKTARERLGGDACLVLSLTESGIEDADIDGMDTVQDLDGTRYVQVRVSHPAFAKEDT
jgi:hypothetical protein